MGGRFHVPGRVLRAGELLRVQWTIQQWVQRSQPSALNSLLIDSPLSFYHCDRRLTRTVNLRFSCILAPIDFINNPLPVGGNGAGAVAPGAAGLNESAGALGLGSVAASAVTNTFTFLAYVVPIYGGIVADTKWGRFKTICVGTFVGAIAHVILVIPAIPSVIAHPNGSLGGFMVSILILSGAAGFIKPSLGPLLCDQSPVKKPTIKVLKSGEKVIVDPQVTVQSYLLIFYACINIGEFGLKPPLIRLGAHCAELPC